MYDWQNCLAKNQTLMTPFRNPRLSSRTRHPSTQLLPAPKLSVWHLTGTATRLHLVVRGFVVAVDCGASQTVLEATRQIFF